MVLNIRHKEWNLAGFLLLIVIAGMVVIRVRLIDVPLERDEGEYAYTAQLLLQGVPPYEGTYSMKFPGIYFLYALVIQTLGHTHIAIHTALLFLHCLSILLLYVLGRSLLGDRAGIFAAATLAVLLLNYRTEVFWANAEHFIVPLALGGVLLLRVKKESTTKPALLASGVLLGLAFLVKQHAFFLVLFGFLYVLVNALKARNLFPVLLFIVGALLPPSFMLAYLVTAGVFDNFVFWTFTYAKEYVSQVPLYDAQLMLTKSFLPIVSSSLPLWMLALGGLIGLALARRFPYERLTILGFFAASSLTVVPGFIFRPHYFVVALPAVSLLTAACLEMLFRFFLPLRSRTLQIGFPAFVVVAALTAPVLHQRDVLFEYSPTMVTRATFGGNPFPESLPLAEFVQRRTKEGDRIAILGSEPQIYFYSQRRSATGYIYMYPLMEPHEYALRMQKEMISQIESSSPKLLIYVDARPSWADDEKSDRTIFEWFRNYTGKFYRFVGRMNVWEDPSVLLTPAEVPLHRSKGLYSISVFERKEGSTDPYAE